MTNRNILITDYDKVRIEEVLLTASMSGRYYPELEEELARAQVVCSGQIEQDVVTMNTKLRMTDLDTNQEFTAEVVFPSDADIDENRISVLSPVGTALLGYRVGDIVDWLVPAGYRHLKIEEILYQPEAAGHIYV